MSFMAIFYKQVSLAAGNGDFPDPLCGSTTWRIELCSIFAIYLSLRAGWQHAVPGQLKRSEN
jgi:23S rRNA G2445 N2-methylase RlmL